MDESRTWGRWERVARRLAACLPDAEAIYEDWVAPPLGEDHEPEIWETWSYLSFGCAFFPLVRAFLQDGRTAECQTFFDALEVIIAKADHETKVVIVRDVLVPLEYYGARPFMRAASLALLASWEQAERT